MAAAAEVLQHPRLVAISNLVGLPDCDRFFDRLGHLLSGPNDDARSVAGTALAELGTATNDAAIVALLKRAAMCARDRTEVGSLTGEAWCRWLSESGRMAVPPTVADRITAGVYRDATELTPELMDFARQWITRHSRAGGQRTC